MHCGQKKKESKYFYLANGKNLYIILKKKKEPDVLICLSAFHKSAHIGVAKLNTLI